MSLVLDDRAGEAERHDLQAHLEGCTRCRDQLAVLGLSSAALRAVGRAEPPAGLAERTARAAFTTERAPARSGLLDLFSFLRWPALATATASLVLALALFVSAPPSTGSAPSGNGSLDLVASLDDVGLDSDRAAASVLAAEED